LYWQKPKRCRIPIFKDCFAKESEEFCKGKLRHFKAFLKGICDIQTCKMAGMASEDVVRIDEVEMGEAGTADGIKAREKEKFEYIHGHVEHQELHVPPLDELCKGTPYVAMCSRDKH
jgi:hypothetical protein